MKPHLVPFPHVDGPVCRKKRVRLAGRWVEGISQARKIWEPRGWERSNEAKASLLAGNLNVISPQSHLLCLLVRKFHVS